ncbi:P-loop containing nucleoside triphosphate hydrolase superfamily protein [Trifolium repens]|nr:P-loop containing nucleoside triphosphate hydrolase superfamily protein [Trifolium repens]
MAGPVTDLSPSDNPATPPVRNVRRRLVQSTLFPHKPPQPRNKPEENEESGDEQDEDYCDTKNRKKRKSKGKITPVNKGSKSATPKKNASGKKQSDGKTSIANAIMGSTSRNVLSDFDKVVIPKPDLRLEAKLSAEENSRMFAGRQVHPFFSSCKAGKKVQELSEPGSDAFKAKSGNESITCGPIHVFENIKDDTSSLDWRNWTFLENSTYVNSGSESSNSSVLGASVECLNFDKLLSTLDPVGASSSQNASNSLDITCPENMQETSLSNSTLPEEQTISAPMPKDGKVDLEVDESGTSSVEAGYFRKSHTGEPLSRFLQESLRSYYIGCEDKAEGSLWTYKYKPTKAVEVCGNDEAVNFLSDWLHQWHERRYKPRKDTSNRDTRVIQDDDDDYICSDSDYDSEDMNEEDSLQNVLLVTGPIGSGKSAAIYACAQEHGFDILELNASDCRNGTVVKQYFGDTLGSHGFKRLSEHTVSSQKMTTKLPPAPALVNGKAADEVNDGVVELITISDDEACSPGEISQKLHGKNNVACDKVQTLILVEDVDILFPEDRGCIAAIQQIAETARGPIILTSNSDNPGLPDNFDRLQVSFSLPTPKELLCHLYSVCIREGASIHPLLLEKFIQSCDGDIRKTIMHLQFWLQSKIFKKDLKAHTGYVSLPFDLEVGHQILPKIMPWDFPSEISELIENEFVKSVNQMEDNSSLQGLVDEELLHINESQNDLDEQYMETDYIKAKKVEMIQRNGSITDYCELEIQCKAISEFSNSSGSPVASYLQNGRRKLVVMSSDSEEEDSNNGYPQDTGDGANKRHSIKGNNECTSEFQLNDNFPSTSVRKLVCSELEDSDDEHVKYSEAVDVTCINDTSQSFDISCVPESTFVPETAIENGTDTMSGAVSSGHCLEVSMNNELKPSTLSVRRRLAKLSENSDILMDTEVPDSSQKDALRDFLDENMETTIIKVMDECSRVDFKLKSTFVESSPSLETDVVQNLWEKLRQMDLKQHAISEKLGVSQVVKLAGGLSNLISEADLFHNYQHKHDILEPRSFVSNETTTSWYNDETMMSSVAVHGFCFYVKLIADVGSKLGCANKIDLTSEVLASTTNTMALGKLSRLDIAKNTVIYTGKELKLNNPMESENKASLFEVVQSIVPARISLALKGDIFNEYLSSLRQISRSEAVRVSQGVEKKRRGRSRGAQHYLSRCTMLSPEDITLVSGDLYRKISSQHTINVESKLL